MGTGLKFLSKEEVIMNQGTSLGSQVGRWILLAALAVALGALLLTIRPAGAQDNGPIEYAENGTDPVATLSAIDPEGATPITWSIAADGATLPEGFTEATDNADENHFDIDSKTGVLTFDIGGDDDTGDMSVAPDFENPKGVALAGTDSAAQATENTYKVVVAASDMETGGVMGYHKVTVMVTNEDEAGKVSWTVEANDADDSHTAGTPKLVQIQVGASLMASVTDGDVRGGTKTVEAARADVAVDPTWQWYRGGSLISGATTDTYKTVAADVGSTIRAHATYRVGSDSALETASLTSDYTVLAARSGDNELKFDPTTVSREVAEGKKGMMVGAPVTATGNHGAVNYTLEESGDATAAAPKFKIDQKTGQITTVVDLDYDTADADNCRDADFCTVTVIATDASGDTAPTNATVTIKVTDVNEAPVFVTETTANSPTAITSPENREALFDTTDGPVTTEVGVTYIANDPESLNVNLMLMGADGAKFNLSSGGVLSFKAKPDYEMPGDADGDNVYEVTVRASDGTMHEDRMVMVTVTGVNEAPEVSGPSSENFAENGEGPVATFTAEDPEGATPITWSIAADGATLPEGFTEATDNADENHFDIDSKTGVLTFDIGGDDDTGDMSVAPDFENPKGVALAGTDSAAQATENTYKVVVAASDMETGGVMGYHKVTVMVTNEDEAGKVSWTVEANDADDSHTAGTPKLVQIQVGASLMASVTDGDVRGGTKTVEAARADVAVDPTWQWYRGGSLISGATTDTYKTVAADVGSTIRAHATYRVGSDSALETASLTSDYTVLAARSGDNELKFDPTTVSREVAEGKKGMMVGAPVTATGNHGAVNYTLEESGDATAAAPKFKIDQKTGQITTVVDLDYDTADADNCRDADFCTVTVIATDASGDTAPTNATVTIKVTDVNEAPVFVTETTANSPTAITSPENREALFDTTDGPVTTEVGVTYIANDPESLNVNLMLMGADGAKFNLSSGGVLSFKAKPDYEMPGDADGDNVYEVTVRASDGTMHEDRMVMVTVTGVNEAPMIFAGLTVTGSRSEEVDENTTPVGTYIVTGPGADTATWDVMGDDMDAFSISGGMLSFASAPDYENPTDMGGNNMYNVMVVAEADGESSQPFAVTVEVTDANDDGMVAGLPATAAVGDVLTAVLNDQDGVTVGTTVWQWTRDGANIEGTDSASYTVTEDDAETALMAMVTYTDHTYGAGMTATGGPVMIDPNTATARYDTNGTPGIQIDEVLSAIQDHYADPDNVTIEDVLSIIEAYYATGG